MIFSFGKSQIKSLDKFNFIINKPMELDNKYHVMRHLGSGAFGAVYLARDENNNYYAIKRQPKLSQKISREIEILLELQGRRNLI